jgi:outer membrane lipoprotein-sorting protein
MTITQKLAAAVMITLGALTLYVMFGVFNAFSPSVAFADVAAKLKDAKTIQYTSSVTLRGTPPISIRTLAAEPDRMRTEMPDGTVTIHHSGVILTLIPARKTAMRTELTGAPEAADGAPSIVDAIKSLGQQKGEPLGERVIDGVKAVGFRATVGGEELTIWADKKTAAPVRVEQAVSMDGRGATMVMDHFVIDAPLDDALFSLDPPAGYKLTKSEMAMPEFGKLEEEVADLLRIYADANGGAFPDRLTNWAAFNKIKGDPQLSMKVGGVSGRLFSLENGYGYAGNGVRRGAKDKIVFWYKPDDAKTYKAVFGDLRVADVAEDKLPSTRPSPGL